MRHCLDLLTSLGLLLFLSSCATGGSGGGEPCRSDLAPHERSLNELVDSAALQQSLQELWTPVDGLVLGWIGYDSTGARETVGIRTESLSETQRLRVEEALFSAVREGPGEQRGRNIFLGDEHGPAVRRLARVQACQPEILNSETLSRALEDRGRRLGFREQREVTLRAFVSEESVVGEVRVHRSSGDLQFDAIAVSIARSAEFRPALIEGIRVSVWTQFPMRYRPRGGGRGADGSMETTRPGPVAIPSGRR